MEQKDIDQIRHLIHEGYYEGLIFPNGVIYQGGFYQGLFHGRGTIILPYGNTYSYEFRNGKLADGRSIIFYPDGSFYEGVVSSNGQPYGKGIIRNINGSIYYQGNWYNNYDPKVGWQCEPFLWYENGRVFPTHDHYNMFELMVPMLFPIVFLQMPQSWDKSKLCSVQVMLPHLQTLGCPSSKNNFTIYRWHTSPEAAVKSAGYNDLQDYKEWVYDPNSKVKQRILKSLELSDKIIEELPIDPISKKIWIWASYLIQENIK